MQIKKELCQFAKKITPKNWNISIEHHGYKGKSGMLNIWLLFHDRAHCTDRGSVGESHSPMRFIGGAAFAEIWLYPLNQDHSDYGISSKGTIIPELAHIAVDRYAAFKEKVYRPDGTMIARMIEEEPHGQNFQRAMRILLNRAISIYGEQELSDLIDEILFDVDQYEILPE